MDKKTLTAFVLMSMIGAGQKHRRQQIETEFAIGRRVIDGPGRVRPIKRCKISIGIVQRER